MACYLLNGRTSVTARCLLRSVRGFGCIFQRTCYVRNVSYSLNYDMYNTKSLQPRYGLSTIRRTLPKVFFYQMQSRTSTSGACDVASAEMNKDNIAISNAIDKQANSASLLDILDQYPVENFTPEQVCNFSRRLMHMHFSEQCEILPWLQSNVHIAYIQLYLRDFVSKSARPLNNHRNFQTFYTLVAQSCDQLNDDRLADCFLSCVYLGVRLDDPLVHKFLLLMHEKISTFSIGALWMTSSVIKALPGFDYFLIRGIMDRLDVLVGASVPSEISLSDLSAMVNVVTNTSKFMIAESVTKYHMFFSECLERDDLVQDPESLGIYLRFCHNSQPKKSEEAQPVLQPIITRLTNACYSVIDRMNPSNIAEICNALKICQRYEPRLAEAIERRAADLLTSESRLCDVTNLMYSFSRSTSENVASRFEAALLDRLIRANDVDIVVLSNIADVLLDFKNTNSDLLLLIQRHISEQSEDIMSYVTRFNKIIRLLLRRRFIDRVAEAKFSLTLLDHFLNKQLGMRQHGLSMAAMFIISSPSCSPLPYAFFTRLMSLIPDWNDTDLCRLITGATQMQTSNNHVLRRQVAQILGLLQTTLVKRLDLIDSVHYLVAQTFSLAVNNHSRDPTLTDRLMGTFPRFTAALNSSTDANSILRAFKQLPYSSPTVLDDITRFIIDNHAMDRAVPVLSLIGACAKIGYVPQRAGELLEVVRDHYRHLHAQHDVKQCVELLRDLSVIQLYPEAELAQLFTLEEIEDIERYIADSSLYGKLVSKYMMELNRNVVLECPQLDVPWFHEAYWQENLEQGYSRAQDKTSRKLREETYEVLSKLVTGGSGGGRVGGGGSGGMAQEYIRCQAKSPYYYNIDFELTLCDKGRPIRLVDVVSSKDVPVIKNKKLNKLAVCILNEGSYCYNSKQLTGWEQMRKRHLEILEYKYIEVPFFDWFSMGLTDWSSKVEYLRAKIFK